ncbi:uncharacterized protein IUM83_13994 [Phytophthora cinnamomi]|uniref:uncharacterized protein n=1 Tax=Phytophthora cinnamomi TaxID=4785 RepID=UPI002A2B9473|nr:hypothetical protein IUM83_13994 [Phytophthora cinnamomi]KAJ8552544.1 hypothetical protein ON010_g10002 [Phytophthora cinnamomi]
MERRKHFRLVRGAVPSSLGVTDTLKLRDEADVNDFREALHCKGKELHLPPSLRASALKVFPNSDQTSLNGADSLDGYGTEENDPLIVQVPKIWFQLKDAETREAFADTRPASVPLTEGDTVEVLLDALNERYNDSHLAGIDVSDLVIYDCDHPEKPLDEDA